MMVHIKEIYSKKFASIQETDSISTCLSAFRKETPPVLAVLNNKGEYKGVIARRWILTSSLDPAKTKVKSFMQQAPAITLFDPISKAARVMVENDMKQLPVYSGDKFKGVVTVEDIIHGMVLSTQGRMKVEQIMTKNPIVVEEEESIGAVIALFREQDITHAPVVGNGKLVGMISIQDLIDSIYQPIDRQSKGERAGVSTETLNLPIKGIISTPLISIPPDTTLKNASEKLHKFDISCLVVIKKKRPVGIITKRDFLETIIQEEMQRSRINIQFSVKDIGMTSAQREAMLRDFDSFAKRYEDTLQAGRLFVYLKPHGTNYKGDQLVHCRLQFRTRKGSFFSSSEGWGVEETFNTALDRIDKQILRSKEMEYNPEYAARFLRRMGLPFFPSKAGTK